MNGCPYCHGTGLVTVHQRHEQGGGGYNHVIYCKWCPQGPARHWADALQSRRGALAYDERFGTVR